MQKIYIAFNKPYNVLSQFSGERTSLADYIPVKGVYPVGRLDRDSEGLLVLTNDGDFQHRLTDPKFQHPRTYWAQVERVPDQRAIERLVKGVVIEGQRTRPAKVRLIDDAPALPQRNPPVRFRKNVPTAWLELTLTEGRNRQVRKMTAAVGFPTLRLVRVAIGDLRLAGLAPGEWKDLTRDELGILGASFLIMRWHALENCLSERRFFGARNLLFLRPAKKQIPRWARNDKHKQPCNFD